MLLTKYPLIALSATALLFGQAEVVFQGLQGPQKLILTSQGNFLVTETSKEINSGKVSFVSRAGVRRSLVEGLPSGLDSQGDGSGPTALALHERTLYITIGGGEIERAGTTPGVTIHNPAGLSSPLFASILQVRFASAVDTLTGTFKLTSAQHVNLSDGQTLDIEDGSGGRAQISLLVKFQNSIPEGTGYRFANPWGLALSADGATLWATDASMNSLNKIDTDTGKWTRQMRFPRIPNAGPIGAPIIDPVPTSVRIYGDQLLVSFLTGFPFSPGYARVQVVNPEARTADPFIYGLTSNTDILWRERPGQRPQFFALEFSTNQIATPAGPGRLLRYDTPTPTVVAGDLRAPVSLAFDPATEEVFILELSGRILKVSAK